MPQPALTVTVGITTCYGSESLIDTARSIRDSRGVGDFRFLLVADTIPLSARLKQLLDALHVEVIENDVPGSQFKKQKQILAVCDSDLVVFTQDDVLFPPDTLREVIDCFAADPDTTFISVPSKPVRATSWLEQVISTGTRLNNRIARRWNRGDNYLSVVGRLMAFRTAWLRVVSDSPDGVVTTDAYRYFECKARGGKYRYLPTVAVLFKNPAAGSEHLRKSSRFQYSQLEMERHFGDLGSEYRIPRGVAIRCLAAEFARHPVSTAMYAGVYAWSRVAKLEPQQVLRTDWEVDVSTKTVA